MGFGQAILGFLRRLFFSPGSGETIRKTAVQYAVMKLAKKPKLAAEIDRVAALIQGMDQSWTPATLANAIRAQIPWGDLDPADRVAVNNLVDLVVNQVVATVPIGELQLPRSEVLKVVGWVREAVALAQ